MREAGIIRGDFGNMEQGSQKSRESESGVGANKRRRRTRTRSQNIYLPTPQPCWSFPFSFPAFTVETPEEETLWLSQRSKKARRQFLEAAAYHLVGTCPAESRFLMWTLDNKEDKSPHNVNQACCYCFQIFLSGNYRVRLKPRIKLTLQVAKLLKKERKNYKLNLKQTKILKRYKASKNVLLVTCNLCGKTSRYYGESREDFGVKTFSNKTPVSNSHSGSKKATSLSSPRASTARRSTPRSSRTPKNAKSHFTQLKKLLQLEEEKSDKGDLKKFLLSLK